ncbi:MAG: ATP-dependent helicase [Candidatus Magasanikbacteria bacterium]|nr:ATP-dependent helicase [Candidatus Magasanikbacteria bacterium]
MIDFAKELNKEQFDVVKNGNGPCLVLAGAGSGKTRTITYRVAYLLEQGVKPEQILLVTFTNKAAREMIERVEKLTDGKIFLPWAGTFHHIAYRILKQYAPLLNYKNSFSILDTDDSHAILKLCLKDVGIDRKEQRFPSPAVIHSIISFARNAGISIVEVLDRKYPQWQSLEETIAGMASDYDRRKKEANVMDFDDLLTNLHLLLLKSETVRNRLGEQFQYILVDEYQDTNNIQASIVKLFSSRHNNLLVVGDDAQSIYSFRAADIQHILQFEKEHVDAKIFRLETNYRSSPDILKVANAVIENNVNQYKKELRGVVEACGKPVVHAFADNAEEAEKVADEIQSLTDEGISPKEIAVLFRAAFHSQALELELTKRGVAYEYRGGVRFFERAHVKDVLAFLRIVNNPEDTIAWSRVLSMQVGIGPAAVEKIIALVRKSNFVISTEATQEERSGEIWTGESARNEKKPFVVFDDSIAAELPSRAQIGWNNFLGIWSRIDRVLEKTPSSLIDAVLHSSYSEYLENEYPDYRERLEDLEQMALFAEKQQALDQFLSEATLQENFRSAGAQIQNGEKIILSTVHQAKGLEWHAVFIIHCAAGQFPNDRAFHDPAGIEEERRLFYVAITRAKKYLSFSYPLVGSFDTLVSGPSMFLEEIDQDLLSTPSPFRGGLGGVSTDDEIVYVSEDEPFPSRPARTSFLKDISDL